MQSLINLSKTLTIEFGRHISQYLLVSNGHRFFHQRALTHFFLNVKMHGLIFM